MKNLTEKAASFFLSEDNIAFQVEMLFLAEKEIPEGVCVSQRYENESLESLKELIIELRELLEDVIQNNK